MIKVNLKKLWNGKSNKTKSKKFKISDDKVTERHIFHPKSCVTYLLELILIWCLNIHLLKTLGKKYKVNKMNFSWMLNVECWLLNVECWKCAMLTLEYTMFNGARFFLETLLKHNSYKM